MLQGREGIVSPRSRVFDSLPRIRIMLKSRDHPAPAPGLSGHQLPIIPCFGPQAVCGVPLSSTIFVQHGGLGRHRALERFL